MSNYQDIDVQISIQCDMIDHFNSDVLTGVDYWTAAELSPLEQIERAEALIDAAARLLTLTVYQARARRHTWQAIGDQLGMSRQAAQQRYGSGRR